MRLKVKVGTQSTFSRSKVEVTWMVPIWVTVTFSPLGNWTKVATQLVILVNRVREWTMWYVAPVSRTQFSLPKAVLLLGLTTNIECSMLRHIDSWNSSQELPESVELAEWIASLEVEAEALALNIDRSCWHCSEVNGKEAVWGVKSDWAWSPSTMTWLAIDTLPFSLYPGGKPASL